MMLKQPQSSKRAPDWEAIEREYRAGQFSVSEIGRLHGVSHTAINKRAKKLGWTRNLAEQVRQEALARLVSDVSAGSTRETITAEAARVVQLVREHRRDIREGRETVNGLFAELREATRGRNDIEEMINDEPDIKRRQAMQRATSLSARSGIAASLAIALKNLIYCERNAFGLETRSSDASNDENTTAGLAERLDAAFKRIEG
jgi:hypothetical protein